MSSPAQPGLRTSAIAWGGGALFVLALAYGAWFFVVVLREPGPPDRAVLPAVAWNAACFTVFAAHHSLMARTRAKAWLQRRLDPALERTVYVWTASLLFVAVCLAWRRVPGVLYTASGPLAWALAGLQLLGLVLTVAGARVLDALDLAGVRQATGHVAPLRIRAVWPFTMVRHPIYLGWVLLVGAASPMTLDRAVWAVVSTAYLILAMPWEERSLAAAAGPAYAAYCRQVKWRLVPGLY
jgi:protein-S-isoprenylcysteine O-methyltransferase Ste14